MASVKRFADATSQGNPLSSLSSVDVKLDYRGRKVDKLGQGQERLLQKVDTITHGIEELKKVEMRRDRGCMDQQMGISCTAENGSALAHVVSKLASSCNTLKR
ncbi:hypothetical protein NDU88_001431 [Pleurodeles waltl]|uniref:Uncharacterized protein n=1 Tax=Pleurodeles waltl TaxID=8319 RepID=A0AAV7P8P0_PLEWA|nr:hypothetical protein NDU88_001431 [Pleurodeles waltl]